MAEHGAEATIDNTIVIYNYVSSGESIDSKVTLVQVGPFDNPQEQLAKKTQLFYKYEILKFIQKI